MPLSANTIIQSGTTTTPNSPTVFPAPTGAGPLGQSIIYTWYAEYVAQMNSGITYGTNSYPGGYSEFAPYFGGPTTGVDTNTNTAAIPYGIGSRGQGIITTPLTTAFLNAVNQWGTIRQGHFYYSVIGGDTTDLGAAVSYLNNSYYASTGQPVLPQAGQLIAAQGTLPSPGTANFTNPGRYPFTVPAGVTSLNLTVYGGGGGAGGHDGGGYGHNGYPGYIMTGALSVNPGDSLTIDRDGD